MITNRVCFTDMLKNVFNNQESECETTKDEECGLVTRQIAAILQEKYGASVKWSYYGNPEECMKKNVPIPLIINGKKGRAKYRFGMISSVEIISKEIKEDDKASFYFTQIAEKYFKEHKKEIMEMAEKAKSNDFESFVVEPQISPEALDPLCNVIVSSGAFAGAKIRRKTRILVALKAEALVEKMRSSHDVKRAESRQKKPDGILKSMACDYLASNFTEFMARSEAARANGKDFVRLKPKIEADALPFLVKELKKRGYKKVNRDKKSIVVSFKENNAATDDDFENVIPGRD